MLQWRLRLPGNAAVLRLRGSAASMIFFNDLGGRLGAANRAAGAHFEKLNGHAVLPFLARRRVIVGTLLSLLLPVCCLLTMGNASPLPSLISAHAESRPLVSGNRQPSFSVLLTENTNRHSASVRSLRQLPPQLTIRRNVRSQAPSRVRRAKKASRAAEPMIGRSFSSSSKPPERAALGKLKILRGRSPPTV